jgi:hypothetical protein
MSDLAEFRKVLHRTISDENIFSTLDNFNRIKIISFDPTEKFSAEIYLDLVLTTGLADINLSFSLEISDNNQYMVKFISVDKDTNQIPEIAFNVENGEVYLASINPSLKFKSIKTEKKINYGYISNVNITGSDESAIYSFWKIENEFVSSSATQPAPGFGVKWFDSSDNTLYTSIQEDGAAPGDWIFDEGEPEVSLLTLGDPDPAKTTWTLNTKWVRSSPIPNTVILFTIIPWTDITTANDIDPETTIVESIKVNDNLYVKGDTIFYQNLTVTGKLIITEPITALVNAIFPNILVNNTSNVIPLLINLSTEGILTQLLSLDKSGNMNLTGNFTLEPNQSIIFKGLTNNVLLNIGNNPFSSNSTLTLPITSGTLALTSNIKDGTLTTTVSSIGDTNTAVSLNLSGTYSANTNENRTIKAVVGPALSNYASTLTGAVVDGAGLLKKTAQDTLSLIKLAVAPVGTTNGLTIEESANTITFKHADTSTHTPENNNGRTYIQNLTLDEYGHVTDISTASETVVNTDTTYSLVSSTPATGQEKITLTPSSGTSSDLTLIAGTNVTLSRSVNAITINSTATGGATGVTSVAAVAGSPFNITPTSGAVTVGLNPVSERLFLAGPLLGNPSPAIPSFRQIAATDIPTLNQNTTGTAAGLSSTLNTGSGGTGLTSYNSGDLLYYSSGTTLTRRAIGSTNQVLTVVGGVPTWATPSGGSGDVTLAGTQSFTGVNTFSNIANNTISATSNMAVIVTGGVGVSGNIVVGSSGNLYFLSDERFKTKLDLVNSDSTLESLLKTDIWKYHFNDNAEEINIGLMAQDLQKNFPELSQYILSSGEDKDNNLTDKLTVKETKLVYVLWSALQEETKKRIELENKLNDILSRIEKLEG